MSPFDGIHECSHMDRSCYVIEEEQPDDTETENKDSEKQKEVRHNTSKNILLEISQNINQYNDRLENNVSYRSDNGSRHVFRGIIDLCNSNEENQSTLKCFQPSKLSKAGRRLSNISSNITHSSIPTSSEATFNDHQLPRNQPLVKSGNLVLITKENSYRSSFSSSISSARITSRTLPSRYPVIVKIMRISYDKYAIISRTRRHPTMSSFILKLKQSHVTRSSSNPSHFEVVNGSATGETFTFEASSPEITYGWIQAFSSDCLCSPNGLLKHSQINRELFPCARTQDMTRGLLSERKLLTSARTLTNSYLMPVLSESSIEDDQE